MGLTRQASFITHELVPVRITRDLWSILSNTRPLWSNGTGLLVPHFLLTSSCENSPFAISVPCSFLGAKCKDHLWNTMLKILLKAESLPPGASPYDCLFSHFYVNKKI